MDLTRTPRAPDKTHSTRKRTPRTSLLVSIGVSRVMLSIRLSSMSLVALLMHLTPEPLVGPVLQGIFRIVFMSIATWRRILFIMRGTTTSMISIPLHLHGRGPGGRVRAPWRTIALSECRPARRPACTRARSVARRLYTAARLPPCIVDCMFARCIACLVIISMFPFTARAYGTCG